MACAASTDPCGPVTPTTTAVTGTVQGEVVVDGNLAVGLSGRYELHPHVALRRESFGALAYHYDNRKLTFLRSLDLVELISSLGDHGSLLEAIQCQSIPQERWPAFLKALCELQRCEVIRAC